MILRSMRALAAGSFACAVTSDLTGLAGALSLPEAVDPSLNTRGRKPGMGSDAAALASTCGSDGDTIRGLGLRPSRGRLLLVPESKLEDFIWRTTGTGGGRSGKLPNDRFGRGELFSGLSRCGPGRDGTLSESRGEESLPLDLIRGEGTDVVGGFTPTADRDSPVERRLITGIV